VWEGGDHKSGAGQRSVKTKQRRTVLELAILGLLKDSPMHGYQLKKSLESTLGASWQPSFGSLYPALRRLERANAVEKVVVEERTSRRSRRGVEKPDRTRRRKVYRITQSGETLFRELLEGDAGAHEERAFSLKLAFCRYMPPEERLGLFERRRAHLTERLAQFRSITKSYMRDAKERLDTYTLSLMRHGLDSTESDIRWLDDLIEAERGLHRMATKGES
jgi:DNA-binding PadR family transcriptional regulator